MMLRFWSRSCLQPLLPQGNVSKQRAASVGCPMQMAVSLKENRFPQCPAPPCSANKEEKRGKTVCSNSSLRYFRQQIAAESSAVRRGRDHRSHQQRASLRPGSAAATHAAEPLLLVLMAIPGNSDSCNLKHSSPARAAHVNKCYKALCPQCQGIHAAPRPAGNKRTCCRAG